MLPRRSGLEICELIRADASLSGTRVLMLTAKGGNRDVHRGVQAGADDYVTKPFSTHDLVARAQALLADPRAAYRAGAPAHAMNSPTPPAGPAQLEPTVFVIDDDESIRELLLWLMKRNAIRAEAFPNARSFLKAYRPGAPGCLVLDLYMPGMSGLDLQKYLRDTGIEMPVIFLSGRADVSKAVLAVKSGAIDFIEKPFDYRQIVDLVRECLRRDADSREGRETARGARRSAWRP